MSESNSKSTHHSSLITPAVIVAALGYFVDIFDLLLFSIVRKPSLASLGLSDADQVTTGLWLHNLQMIGMLIGGIFWGILGDKRGRLNVLFGSILLYSIANIANGFVNSVESYALWRFIAGIGLAGELGAGITLVAESLPKEKRGIGTMIVASIGVSGAVVAGTIAEYFEWRTTYMIGGGLGLALLLLRINTAESMLFQASKNHGQGQVKHGDFLSLFKKPERVYRLLLCILIGVPIWFVIGTLVQLAPEFAREFGIMEPVTAGKAVVYSYAGLVVGDLLSGAISQVLKSRRKVLFLFLAGLLILGKTYFGSTAETSAQAFYYTCFGLGLFAGYWAIFVTIAAEQFGTNMRATIATSVPNFVRSSVVPMSIAFTTLRPEFGMINAAALVGITVTLIAGIAAYKVRETFHLDLNYLE